MPQLPQPELRVKTAEDFHKEDIAIRRFELINAKADLKTRMILGGGPRTEKIRNFYMKFLAFFDATRFYLNEKIVEQARKALENFENNGRVHELLAAEERYAEECYKKDLFIKGEVIVEEGEEVTEG